MHYLEVPQEVVQQLGATFNVRLCCTVNSSLTFQCGLVALGQGMGYISINSKRMKELGVRNGDIVTVALEKDESDYGLEMPPELTELLQQDEEGMARFRLLTPGRQRYIIHYVSAVKSSQLRIDRAILLIENLKRLSKGKESFRDMLGLKK
jgi:hypothetical protein